MTEKTGQIHGRDHNRTGIDPIPDLGPRIVYGRVLDDGTLLEAGSGDWSSGIGGYGAAIVVEIDPPFTVGFSFVACPNDNTDGPFTEAPDLVQPSGLSYSGFVMGYQVDLATVVIFFWDLDGNAGGLNRCGFDFQAVGA